MHSGKLLLFSTTKFEGLNPPEIKVGYSQGRSIFFFNFPLYHLSRYQEIRNLKSSMNHICLPLSRSGRVTVLHAEVSGSNMGRVGNFNKRFILEIRRDGGAGPQSLASFSSLPEFNSQSVCSVNDVKAYMPYG